MEYNEHDFDSELRQLLEDATRQTAEQNAKPAQPDTYLFESIDQERWIVLNTFYDLYATFQEKNDPTVDGTFLEQFTHQTDRAIFDDDELGDEAALHPIDHLNESLQHAIEAYPMLYGGVMHVEGRGLFLASHPETDHDDMAMGDEVCMLEGGSIMGSIRQYDIMPLVPYTVYEGIQSGMVSEQAVFDDLVAEDPGVWVTLKDATVRDQRGEVLYTGIEVSVPLNYPSVHFAKAQPQHEVVQQAHTTTGETVTSRVSSFFKNGFIDEMCLDAERDLDYNDYTEAEERAARESHQDDLSICMSAVSREDHFCITASEAMTHAGVRLELTSARALYLDPVLLKIRDNWRAVHAFMVETKQGTVVVHILPEQLHDIQTEAEK